MANDCHIYVIFTPHHALAAERIIKLSTVPHRTIVVTTLQTTGDFSGSEIIRFPSISSLRNFAAELVIRRRKKALHDLFESISDDTRLTLLVPHYQNIISNYLAFFLLNDLKLKRVLIPDGVLSYYRHRVSFRDFLRQLVFKICSIAMGLNFKFLWKSIDFPDDKNDAIYTYAPSCVYNESASVIPIPVQKKHLPAEFSNAVILGTRRYNKGHLDYASQVASLLTDNPTVTQVYFKKHPAFRGEDPVLRRMRDNSGGFRLAEIADSVPIEEIVDLYSIKKIIDFGVSTSSIELQILYCNQLEISVYERNLLQTPYYHATFCELARKFNLTIVS